MLKNTQVLLTVKHATKIQFKNIFYNILDIRKIPPKKRLLPISILL